MSPFAALSEQASIPASPCDQIHALLRGVGINTTHFSAFKYQKHPRKHKALIGAARVGHQRRSSLEKTINIRPAECIPAGAIRGAVYWKKPPTVCAKGVRGGAVLPVFTNGCVQDVAK